MSVVKDTDPVRRCSNVRDQMIEELTPSEPTLPPSIASPTQRRRAAVCIRHSTDRQDQIDEVEE
jgi:hypothetical protein